MPGLNKAEDVVDQKQNVAMLIVAKILGHVSAAAPTRNRLPGGSFICRNHHHVFQDAGVFHAAIEFFAFTATLADSAKNAHAL